MRITFGKTRLDLPYAVSDAPRWRAMTYFLTTECTDASATRDWLDFVTAAAGGDGQNSGAGNATGIVVQPPWIEIEGLFWDDPPRARFRVSELVDLLRTWIAYVERGEPTAWTSSGEE
jgi:hypothetical protein